MSTVIHQLIYTSCPSKSLNPTGLADLMVRARAHNASRGITGVLLHTREQFLQVVEGPQSAVEQLMERIHLDTRHDDVRVIMAHTVARRDFGEWDMALREVSGQALGSGSAISEFFKPGFDIRSLHHGSPASFLLRAFRELHVLRD